MKLKIIIACNADAMCLPYQPWEWFYFYTFDLKNKLLTSELSPEVIYMLTCSSCASAGDKSIFILQSSSNCCHVVRQAIKGRYRNSVQLWHQVEHPSHEGRGWWKKILYPWYVSLISTFCCPHLLSWRCLCSLIRRVYAWVQVWDLCTSVKGCDNLHFSSNFLTRVTKNSTSNWGNVAENIIERAHIQVLLDNWDRLLLTYCFFCFHRLHDCTSLSSVWHFPLEEIARLNYLEKLIIEALPDWKFSLFDQKYSKTKIEASESYSSRT